jgi:GT2 family glycosyltransferase
VSEEQHVVAVVVTWNRRELLTEALTAVLGQTRRPDRLIVVDNASTDGTAELVRTRFPEAVLVAMESNTGGAGGFAAGIARGLAVTSLRNLANTVLWVMDDDTVPEPTALAALLAAYEGYVPPLDAERYLRKPVLVASRVIWTDGRAHPMNTPRVWSRADPGVRTAAASVDCLPIRSASFVSVLLNADWVDVRGLPIADYFLWNDDFEFTTRLIRGQVGLLCPQSVVVHKTAVFGTTDADPGPRFYYEVRNKIWMFTRSDGLSRSEKVLYGGATLIRWGRTMVKASDRRIVLRAGWRGLRDGFTRAPGPPHEMPASTDE